MSTAITVWRSNDADHPLSVDSDEALDAFAVSFYARPKSTPMSIEERVHLFMESRYGIFVAPDSRDAGGHPSLSEEEYRRFMLEAERRVEERTSAER